MNFATLLGYVATAVSVISFSPQVIKSWKTRQTKDVSMTGYLFLALGATLWLIYGILIKNLPIALTNGIVLILQLSVIFLKLRYG